MKGNISRRRFLEGVGVGTAAVALIGPEAFLAEASSSTVTIGARNFTEELLAGYLYAELLAHHGVKVKTSFGFGAEAAAITALKSGDIDLLPDYLGNGLEVDLGRTYKPGTKVYDVWVEVNRAFQKKYHITWLNPAYRFNDQNVFVTTKAKSKKFHLKTLSDLAREAPKLRFETLLECTQRADCLLGFNKVYKPGKFKQFSSPTSGTTPAEGPFYGDLLTNKFDVVQGYGVTDSAIQKFHFVPLKDNKHMFPPDQMTPVVRTSVLKSHPSIKRYLNALAPYLTNSNFRKMNFDVDYGGKQPQAVAHAFLKSHHLI